MEKYFLLTQKGKIDVEGKPVVIPNHESVELFIHKDFNNDYQFINYYTISEKRSGLKFIANNSKTKKGAIEQAIFRFNVVETLNDEKYLYDAINQSLKRYAPEQPLYDIPTSPKLTSNEKIEILQNEIIELEKSIQKEIIANKYIFANPNTQFQETCIKRYLEKITELKSKQ